MISAQDQAWFKTLKVHSTERTYAPQMPVNFQGEKSEYIGLVLSGRAKATAYSENGDQTWLGEFSEGEFFGHVSFLTHMPMNFEIVAETELTAYIIPINNMRELLDSTSNLGEVLAKDLALRLDTMTCRLIEALTLSARGRVCAELLRLSNPIGIDPDRSIIRPNPVFVELALRVNSTRETVSRTVSELQKKGVVSRKPGALIVEHPQRLQSAINQ